MFEQNDSIEVMLSEEEIQARVAPERLLTSEEMLHCLTRLQAVTNSYLRRIPDASRSAAAGDTTWHGI